jgi:HD-GYP domain-containing protein (c-di-GMP phosphodiesterase class II)/CRP-like cAMP-binding protein
LHSSLTSDSSVEDFIANNPLFYSLPRTLISTIAPYFKECEFAAHEIIFAEGSIGDCFYIIRRGQVQIMRLRDGEELVLSELDAGDGFGEMALMIDQPRSATVRASENVKALVLNRDNFLTLSRSLPALAEKFNKLLAERVSLLESGDPAVSATERFKSTRSKKLDYSYLDLLMRLNEAAGGDAQVEHCRETGKLAKEVSKMLCPMVSEEIFFAGFLHEIGKVSLPRELLVRERTGGELSDSEREKFTHIFKYAVEILQPNPSLCEAVSFIQYLDRTSYAEMPLEAQILKAVDDFLMLSSHSYLNLGIEAALEIIHEKSGTLYNPRVVAALDKNLRKFNSVQVDSQLSVLKMMVIALDRKDLYTWRHSMDVRDMGLRLCKRLGLGRKETEYTRIGSELHDVGKIFIDESVLNAPRKLTDEEFAIMKTHAGHSGNFLRDIPGMDELATIVRAHHEKFDGSGYPDGLRGEEIPFLARIMTIADVWSALTTARVYRLNADGSPMGFDVERAVNIMSDMNSKGHFDPQLFPEFCEIVKEIQKEQLLLSEGKALQA